MVRRSPFQQPIIQIYSIVCKKAYRYSVCTLKYQCKYALANQLFHFQTFWVQSFLLLSKFTLLSAICGGHIMS